MSEAPFTPPRKKHNVLWWLGGCLVLLLLLFLLQLFGPNPSIIVSPQTTHITKPLGPDGLPDYERHLLELSREGVTPENNAAPLLWQALFPGELDPKYFAATAAEFGLEQIPSQDEALVPLQGKANRQAIAALLRQRAGVKADDEAANLTPGYSTDPFWNDPNSPVVEQVLDQTMRQPWTAADLPPLAQWAAANEMPLNLIVEASRRPRYYFPSPTFLNKERDLLISMLLPHVQSVREAGRSLPARAMWHLGEGRPDDAWRDLLAVHRLSFLLTQGHTLVEQLVAIAMSGAACDGTVALLHHARLTPEQARQVQRDLAGLPNFAVMARSLDETERAAALDAFIRVGSGGGGAMYSALGGESDFGNGAFDVISVDWNFVLRDTNRWYDRLAAAASLPDRAARVAALEKIEADVQRLAAAVRSPGQMVAGVVSRTQRSKLVSGIMLSLFLPAVTAATDVEDRANTMLELTRFAAALAVYRAEQGAYPENLKELTPGVLDEVPVDLYNAKPFVYKRLADGFLLYSAGENGTDDGGSNARLQSIQGQVISELDEALQEQLVPTIPAGADDISIRAQRRVFEWPKLAPPAGEP